MSTANEEALKKLLPGRLLLFSKTQPERPALRHKQLGVWREISWLEYCTDTAATARMLEELGVGAGDHVAILSDNRPEWLYADLGAQAIGARSVGIYQTSPAPDVEYILNHSQAKVLFCEDQEQVDKFMEIAGELPQLEHVIAFEPRGTREYGEPRLMEWNDFISRGRTLLQNAPDWLEDKLAQRSPDEPSMVVYTSGTTGKPKGALIGSANVTESVDALVSMLGAESDDLILSYLPLCHVAEKIYSVFLPLTTGMIVHFGESIDTVQEDLREVSPTIFLGVPRIWERTHSSLMIKMQNSSALKKKLFFHFTEKGGEIQKKAREGRSLSLADRINWKLGDLLVFRPLQERLGLRRCRMPTSGAAPIAPELLEWFHGIGVPIGEGYGMTELAGASHFNPPDAFRIGTVGKRVPTLEHRIADDGEICIRGSSVFMGYLHNEDATREMIDDEGWLHTGDIGEIDDDGFLKITGRKKEIIITAGGKNLSPEKIENTLKTSAYIKEAVAIGDRRKFVSALVQIDYESVGDWAQRRQLPYTSYGDLASKGDVIKLVEDEIKRVNAALAQVESVRSFKILPKELHQDDGELTATQKVRRKVITERYGELIESIYGGGGR
ncbi:MAG: AMP-binding protein [Myxococcales bacterium]|nr:AMP-binding protein [Myxococcales bacterium]